MSSSLVISVWAGFSAPTPWLCTLWLVRPITCLQRDSINVATIFHPIFGLWVVSSMRYTYYVIIFLGKIIISTLGRSVQMAALQPPFNSFKSNWNALRRNVERCDYPPIPSDLYSPEVSFLIVVSIFTKNFFFVTQVTSSSRVLPSSRTDRAARYPGGSTNCPENGTTAHH